MANLNYATEYQRGLEQAFPYVLHFGKLYSTPNNGRFRWVNGKTIEIPSISTSGRTNADRDSIGTAQRNYNNAWETKTLTNERKWSTLVHPKDIEQTSQATSIANITKVFNEEHKFPEMDAYLISTLYYNWVTSISATTGHNAYVGHTADKTVVTANNVLEVFDSLVLKMNNARVPVTGRVLYCTYEVKSILKKAAGLTRTWDVQVSADGINREVESLDGVEIIAVPAELMKTKYNFSDTNGWAVDATAAQVEMLMIHPTAVITPVSYSFSKLDAPSALTEGKYYYYEESFEDVFILNNKADAIQFVIDETPAALTVTSTAGTTSSGDTVISVSPEKSTTDGKLYYIINASADPAIPAVGSEITTTAGYTELASTGAIASTTTGHHILVVETVKSGTKYYAIKAGTTTITAKA